MDKATINKAIKIVKAENVKLLDGWTWTRMHFEVTNLRGKIINVWRIEIEGELEWHCDSITEEGFGCIMNNPFQKTPQCSHTLAVELWLRYKAQGELNG